MKKSTYENLSKVKKNADLTSMIIGIGSACIGLVMKAKEDSLTDESNTSEEKKHKFFRRKNKEVE